MFYGFRNAQTSPFKSFVVERKWNVAVNNRRFFSLSEANRSQWKSKFNNFIIYVHMTNYIILNWTNNYTKLFKQANAKKNTFRTDDRRESKKNTINLW